ncbi:MAG: GLUG motif-containing protein, partial [Candidatus Natronoplasma sp.]
MNEYIKKYLTVSVVLLLVIGLFAVAVGSAGSSDENEVEESSLEDESTSADDPIEIEGWHDLDEVRDDLNGDYILMNDLDEDTDGYNEFVDTEDGWEPIGDCDDEDVEFNGTFDGNGYEIRDLYIDRSGEDFLGLFGWSEGKLVNISLVNTNVSGDSYVGGLVGLNVGTVSNSYATGNVRGKEQVGGLVGGISHGRSHHDSIVEDSYATGDVSGEEYIGGLVGKNSGTLSDSYSTGNVIGERYVGGLVGSTLDGSTNVENSHYNIDEVLINGEHRVTLSGLFDKQYQDWMEDKELDIEDYSDSLEPAGEYYEISDVQGIRDLLGFAREDKYKFRLVDDLDLSGEQDLYIPYFGAEFEGNGYTISNLELDLPFVAFIGLFGCNDGGLVRDIELVNINMTGYFFVGGLVGYNFGTVENSHATGNVSGEDYVGGLVGSNEGTVSNSYATGNVKGSGNVGGLVGLNRDIVKNSYATGDVSGDRQVSGLVGYNSGTSTVSNSYATGDVDGETNIGG